MAKHTTRFIRREEVAADTMSFFFERPKGFEYKAGQHVTVELEAGGEKRSHTFTLSSAPHEEELTITTRMRDSAFKRALQDLQPGAEARIQGPSGSLTLPSDEKAEVVFIAGGIGVTPFRSMVQQAEHDRRSGPITLFFSDHQPKEAPFFDELVGTMTAMDESAQAWDGETGHIDADMLERHLNDLAKPTFYVAGPPDMVDSIQDMLREAGVEDKRIEAEEFAGY